MGRGRRTAAAVLVVGLLAACAAEPSAPSTEDGGASPDASLSQEPLAPSPDDPASRPTIAADAFAFAAPALGGGQVEGGELVGQDVALWFWAPWCPDCNREAPGVAELARQFDGQVRVVGVASRDEVPAMEAFVAEHGLEHVTTVADVDGAVWQRFGVIGQPTWIFVDGETGAAATRPGYLPDADLAEILQTLEG